MAVLLRKMLWWWPQYDFHRDTKLQDISADTYTRIEDQPRDVELLSSTSPQNDKDSNEDEANLLGRKRRRRAQLLRLPSYLPRKDYESLDYDACENVPYKETLALYSTWTYWHISLMRWVLVGIIGVLTGITAFLINIGIHYLRQFKNETFFVVYNKVQEPESSMKGMIFLGLVALLAFNMLYALISAILVAFEPVAAGSGIPEIKCYLNGVKIPRVGRLRTIIAKAVGVLFSVAGGFLVGKEGPMIHSGAIIGAGIPQLRSFLVKALKLPYPYFRSDRDKRDFVACGAAAGVAAAFGAPIGGVLFSLEEGASFWNQSLTWQTLFCAMCSTLSLNFFLTLSPLYPDAKFGQLDQPGLVDFGRFFSGFTNNLWTVQYLFLFMVMGAVGGLLGAWFNSLNKRLTLYRMKNVFRKNIVFKIMEVILVSMATTVSVFLAATLLGTCVPFLGFEIQQGFNNDTINYFCPSPGTLLYPFQSYYNDMATLVFSSEEDTIKQLFHQDGAFSLATLGIAFIIYFFLAMWTYGSGIPSGLFVPCITVGALYGRFVVSVFWYFGWSPPIYPGTFALIGAAAFLGGVVRMTVSLTVILIEATDEIEYGLPLLVTLMIAKWVGDLFNEGLYDIHIELKEVPLLGWDSSDRMDKLEASDVMNSNIRYIYPITRVRSIIQLLKTTAHNAFFVVSPVVTEAEDRSGVSTRPRIAAEGSIHESFMEMQPQLYASQSVGPVYRTKIVELDHSRRHTRIGSVLATVPESPRSSINFSEQDCASNAASTDEDDAAKPMVLHGTILRSQLVTLLERRIFFSESRGATTQPTISQMELRKDYPRFKGIFDVRLSEEDKEMLMDVSLYMNPCPYTISHHAPLPRCFNLFRTMGLRHLPVIQDAGIVVGMITRHDLSHEHLSEVLRKKALRVNGTNRSGVLLSGNELGSSLA